MEARHRYRAGDQVPHFEVETLDATVFAYRSIWQRHNLVLVLLPDDGESVTAERFRTRAKEWSMHNAACILTRSGVPGFPHPGLVIADKWGEISAVIAGAPGLSSPDDAVGWLEYLQRQCPECEGESR